MAKKRNFIHSLQLVNYRNFKTIGLDFLKNIIIFYGPNGGGKSNILESISLLSPGRGFRRSLMDDITLFGQNFWQVSFRMECDLGEAKVINVWNNKTRKITYNGQKIANSELTKIVHVIWLVPHMNNIFLSSTSERRKFLDRVISNFDSQHLEQLLLFEKLTSQRLSFFRVNAHNFSSTILDVLEQKISTYSYRIFQRRERIIKLLQTTLDSSVSPLFPTGKLVIKYKHQLFQTLEVSSDRFIEILQLELKNNRAKDAMLNQTLCSVNKLDFFMIDSIKNIPAQFCSTGEQKIMLLSLVMAQVNSLIDYRDVYPILILDEVFVHLDIKHREFLMNFIQAADVQVFLTVNDLFLVQNIIDNSQVKNILI